MTLNCLRRSLRVEGDGKGNIYSNLICYSNIFLNGREFLPKLASVFISWNSLSVTAQSSQEVSNAGSWPGSYLVHLRKPSEYQWRQRPCCHATKLSMRIVFQATDREKEALCDISIKCPSLLLQTNK